jgi:hypothetical protein
MTKLSDKLKHALDETLILATGVQILIGFDYRAPLEKSFSQAPQISQYLKLVSLTLNLITLALVLTPVAYHRLIESGQDSERLCTFVRRVIILALPIFAAGLSLDAFFSGQRVLGTLGGVIFGVITVLAALFFWFGIEVLGKRLEERRNMEGHKAEEQGPPEKAKPPQEETKLADKVDHVLTEARVVLPGAQALLGFQFASVLVEGFEKLDTLSKYLHLAGLAFLALATMLLMAPAAYHRIVEQGEDTEHFHHLAGRLVLAAMVPLALGICLDFYVVAYKVTDSIPVALGGAGLVLLFFYGLWFGFTFYRRSQRRTAQPSQDKRLSQNT